MLEFFIETLFAGAFRPLMTYTGRGLVYAVTFGYARIEDDAALIVGIILWIAIFVAIAVFAFK